MVEMLSGTKDMDLLDQAIMESQHVFQIGVDRATEALRRSPLEAVIWAQVSADFAWHSHGGFFSSSVLERLLTEIAQELKECVNHDNIKVPVSGTLDRKKHILHVMTQAYPIGGHTRVVERWIKNTTPDYIHSLIITNQIAQLPSWLVGAVLASGGWFVNLEKPFTNHLRRAIILRNIACEWADVVVLHTHPCDTIPVLAFGVNDVPPVILFNHADHVFWLGVSIADVVADIRPSGQALSLNRRGVRRSCILPIPLTGSGAKMTRAAARRSLGLSDDTIVMLTIGSSYKYTPYKNCNFVSTLSSIVKQHQNAVLLVVGPSDEGEWAWAKTETGGRIQAFGPQTALEQFHAACDIYIDPFPLASLTAMLEVGIQKKAVVGLSNLEAPIFSGDDLSLCSLETHLRSIEEYRERINRLILDSEARETYGSAIGDAIQRDHFAPGWNRHLDEVLSALPHSHTVSVPENSSASPSDEDRFLAGFQAAVTPNYKWLNAVAAHSRYFPAAVRRSMLWDRIRGGRQDGYLPMRAYVSPAMFRLAYWVKHRV